MQELKSPDGEAVISDRIMALNEWAHSLKATSRQTMLFAGMGRPTYPVPISVAASLAGTAGVLVSTSYNARAILEQEEKTRPASDSITPFSRITLENVKKNGYASIEYRESSAGDIIPRVTMAAALSENYKVKNLYSYEDIVFTNGGSAGLASIFEVINRMIPNGRIITPAPFYSLHAGDNRLHTIDLMKLPGYLLTSEELANAIASAKSAAALDGGKISAFLFCYPHNPTGTSLSEE
ncbi:MAG: aminotransferase class I/II-fold pyridoxal phosphate-dependent enzyme, partial [Pseudomonadota bacterium]|nr:aminotransferase class I/II-fold pyridoxal phosphate-dependent enzyme [Pseudomonadota bacterium]